MTFVSAGHIITHAQREGEREREERERDRETGSDNQVKPSVERNKWKRSTIIYYYNVTDV